MEQVSPRRTDRAALGRAHRSEARLAERSAESVGWQPGDPAVRADGGGGDPAADLGQCADQLPNHRRLREGALPQPGLGRHHDHERRSRRRRPAACPVTKSPATLHSKCICGGARFNFGLVKLSFFWKNRIFQKLFNFFAFNSFFF